MDMLKRCFRCREYKELKCYGRNKRRKDGLRGECKECRRKMDKKSRLINMTRHAIWRSKTKSDIHVDYFENKFRENPYCELTGWLMDSESYGFDGPSIDQVIPANGYTINNTRLICYGVNMMLRNYGVEKLLEVADAIRAYRQKDVSVYEYEPSLV